MDLAERFWAKVRILDGDSCWEWSAARHPTGYGRFSIGGRRGRMVQAHRVAWELSRGAIPEGLLVRHVVCDNPPCCNPQHMDLGTQTDNMRDMAQSERGHTVRLTAADVCAIRKASSGGASQRSLAREYGVAQSNIGYIVRRETWAHID